MGARALDLLRQLCDGKCSTVRADETRLPARDRRHGAPSVYTLRSAEEVADELQAAGFGAVACEIDHGYAFARARR